MKKYNLYGKKYFPKIFSLVLACFIFFGCTEKKTTQPLYDYYFVHHQSLMVYQDKTESRSKFLSVPGQYQLEQMKLSSDRKYVAFLATYLDRQILFIADANGANMRRIMDGKKIIFDGSPHFSRMGIVQVEEDFQFFYLFDHHDQEPRLIAEADDFTWSPSGAYACLHSHASDNPGQYIVHQDGSGLRHIAEGHFLGWTSDGNHFFVQKTLSEEVQLKVYHYDGSFIHERALPMDTQIHFRSSPYEEKILFSFTSPLGSINAEWFDIKSRSWEPQDDSNLIDYIRSHRPEVQWELELLTFEDHNEIAITTPNETETIIKGKSITIISVSPDQSRMICKVKEERGIRIYYIDAMQNFSQKIARGKSVSIPEWHPDSSRVGLSLDDQMMIVEAGINLTIHTYDNSAFLGWKLSS